MHNFLREAAHRQNDRQTNRPHRITPAIGAGEKERNARDRKQNVTGELIDAFNARRVNEGHS